MTPLGKRTFATMWERSGIGGLNARRPRQRRIAPLLQLIGHFVDPGLDASLVLFTAGRA
jgi:hypothetical protein